MTDALIAFASTMLLGIIILVKIWWDGDGTSWRFTKWFSGICLAVALVVGGITFFKI
ncbi:hypothetical protein SAMN04487969_11358 [Paenibacillus algorifonticola]|uniref:Uncharacterized protein n=1 Tax=Paenibacillus algorifonticola TaxID=684063 RepID=A0A1I2FTR1_9BACL|nr:hypothetical protein [Paenibacillus algorifonticola]SFF07831.1 hypothetical protein SAMN04487969_11358 [Paenibacillus algorifonticola]